MARREPLLFSEAQPVRQRRTIVLLGFPPTAMLFVALRQIVWHKPWGNPPMSNGGVIFLTVLLLAVYFRLITVKLVTELRPRELAVGLRGFWKRRTIPLEQIRSAEAVTYDAMKDFGGYGIRSGGRGAAYIARGNQAVELVLASGQKILVGSQTAAELARKITEQRKEVQG